MIYLMVQKVCISNPKIPKNINLKSRATMAMGINFKLGFSNQCAGYVIKIINLKNHFVLSHHNKVDLRIHPVIVT